jgi:import inner membrane translocase subunit TIM50
MTFMLLGGAAGLIWFCIHYDKYSGGGHKFTIYILGRSKRDESGAVMQDKYSGSLLAPVYRIADGFRDWMNVSLALVLKKLFIFQYAVEPAREKLLPDPLKAPFIQPKYTLVIEMKNVLVAPEWTVN